MEVLQSLGGGSALPNHNMFELKSCTLTFQCLPLLSNYSSGRVDALDPSAVTPDGRLPNADVGAAGTDPDDGAHLRTIFGRMGFNDQGKLI